MSPFLLEVVIRNLLMTKLCDFAVRPIPVIVEEVKYADPYGAGRTRR